MEAFILMIVAILVTCSLLGIYDQLLAANPQPRREGPALRHLLGDDNVRKYRVNPPDAEGRSLTERSPTAV
jgi:hypothetical protein